MKTLIFLICAVGFFIFTVANLPESQPKTAYPWAAERCGPDGWRTIIINRRGDKTVKCVGGGVHLLSERRVPE